jgi:hypothetical protein
MTPSKFARATVALWRVFNRMDEVHAKACALTAEKPITRWKRKQLTAMCREHLRLSNRALRLTKKLMASGHEFPTFPPKACA